MTNVTVHHNVTEMATLMHAADLSVGAPSSASWERCCLGLPTLLIGVAENQRRVASALADAGAAQYLGWYDEVRAVDVVSAIEHLRSDPSRLASMSRAAAAVTDGRGAERVVEVIQSTVLRGAIPQEEGHSGDIQTV
jgi:Spore coat polysaccharide biosynthesis protein, predicted glycosyltransferase